MIKSILLYGVINCSQMANTSASIAVAIPAAAMAAKQPYHVHRFR